MSLSKLAPLFVAGGLAVSVGAACAYPGVVRVTSPLRCAPGARIAIVAMIPASAAVDVGPCRAWCQITFGGAVGFVQSPLVIAGAPAPDYYGYGAAAPVFGYVDSGPTGLLGAPVDGLPDDDADVYVDATPPAAPPVMAGF